jgi:hypothetical protein
MPPGQSADTDITLHVADLLNGLDLGDHDEAERRVSRLFVPLLRTHERAAVDALIRLATTTEDHTTQLVACSLVEAADRLDPTLISIDAVERMARSDRNSLRISAAVLLWASAVPGRVPIPLLARLTQPSTEDWYIHAPPCAAAKQLLLARGAVRTVFDRMVSSRDRDDRAYAATDLLEVARIEPRAVPVDLARTLAHDRDEAVAARRAELLGALQAVDDAARESTSVHSGSDIPRIRSRSHGWPLGLL